MQYRRFGKTEEKVSALGFGCMRFPITDKENDASIDEQRAVAMIRKAVDCGVNYLDTAFFYHKGMSEKVVGKAIKDGYREKVFLATKLPLWNVEKEEDFDTLLNTQLEKLDVDYIDFYLLHAVNKDSWEQKVLAFGILDKMKKAKAEGKIRHIGFSFHDDLATFKKVVDGFDAWEFCQIQFNYIDTDYQAGIEGLQYAAERDLGVVIMEPLQGGSLANPAQPVLDVIGNRNPVKFALDYIWNFPEVSLLLSGMSDEKQVEDNLRYAAESKENALTDEEKAVYAEAKKTHDALKMIPCRDCRYCLPCPHGVEIPRVFQAYNGGIAKANRRLISEIYPDIKINADKCEKCGECETKCPQHIEIINKLKAVRGAV
ncbi:MAG: aldo/keto reductase [Ruminococcaceae bacterium]|nr:aldo/keto reductase [Oscillospiraceae bacterium]